MSNKYEVKISDYKAQTFIGVRKTVKFDDLADFFEQNYNKLEEHMKANNIEYNGVPSAVYYGWNMNTHEADLAAVIPVSSPICNDDIISIDLPDRQAYTTDYFGPYDEMMPAYVAVMNKIKEDNNEMDLPCLEVYVTDPVSEPDNTKWHTKIVIFTKKEKK